MTIYGEYLWNVIFNEAQYLIFNIRYVKGEIIAIIKA